MLLKSLSLKFLYNQAAEVRFGVNAVSFAINFQSEGKPPADSGAYDFCFIYSRLLNNWLQGNAFLIARLFAHFEIL